MILAAAWSFEAGIPGRPRRRLVAGAAAFANVSLGSATSFIVRIFFGKVACGCSNKLPRRTRSSAVARHHDRARRGRAAGLAGRSLRSTLPKRVVSLPPDLIHMSKDAPCPTRTQSARRATSNKPIGVLGKASVASSWALALRQEASRHSSAFSGGSRRAAAGVRPRAAPLPTTRAASPTSVRATKLPVRLPGKSAHRARPRVRHPAGCLIVEGGALRLVVRSGKDSPVCCGGVWWGM